MFSKDNNRVAKKEIEKSSTPNFASRERVGQKQIDPANQIAKLHKYSYYGKDYQLNISLKKVTDLSHTHEVAKCQNAAT